MRDAGVNSSECDDRRQRIMVEQCKTAEGEE